MGDDVGVPFDLEDRFRERLRVFATRRLGDPAAAEDVAQETLARVVDALERGRLDDVGALAGFVFQTARHVCMHHVRKVGRERRALDRFVREPLPSAGESALLQLVTQERRRQVRAALDSLGSADRELLSLFYYRDLGTHEIARQLGVEPGALRVRKHRALRRLEQRLGEVSSEAEAEHG